MHLHRGHIVDIEWTTQSECRLAESITFFDGFVEYYLNATTQNYIPSEMDKFCI